MNNEKFFNTLNKISYTYKISQYKEIYKNIFIINNEIQQLRKSTEGAAPKPTTPEPPVVKLAENNTVPSFSKRDEASVTDMALIPDDNGANELSKKVLRSYAKQSNAARILAPWLAGKFGRDLSVSPEAVRPRMGLAEETSPDGSVARKVLHKFVKVYTTKKEEILEHFDRKFKDAEWEINSTRGWRKLYNGIKAPKTRVGVLIHSRFSGDIENGRTPEQEAFEKERKSLTLHPFNDAVSSHDFSGIDHYKLIDDISTNPGFQWRHFSRTHPLTGYLNHFLALSSSDNHNDFDSYLKQLISLDYAQTKPELVQADIQRNLGSCIAKKNTTGSEVFAPDGFLATDAANGFPRIFIDRFTKSAKISWTNPFTKLRVEAPISLETLASLFPEKTDINKAKEWSRLLGVPSNPDSPLVVITGNNPIEFKPRRPSIAANYFSSLDDRVAISGNMLAGNPSVDSFQKPDIDIGQEVQDFRNDVRADGMSLKDITETENPFHQRAISLLFKYHAKLLHNDIHNAIQTLFKQRTLSENFNEETLPAIHQNFEDINPRLFDISLFDQHHKNDANMGSDAQLQKTHKELLLYKILESIGDKITPAVRNSLFSRIKNIQASEGNYDTRIAELTNMVKRLSVDLNNPIPELLPNGDWDPFIHPNSFIVKESVEPYLSELGIMAQPFFPKSQQVLHGNLRLIGRKPGEAKKTFFDTLNGRVREMYSKLRRQPGKVLTFITGAEPQPIRDPYLRNFPISDTNNGGFDLGSNWRAGFSQDMIDQIQKILADGDSLKPFNIRPVSRFMETDNPRNRVSTVASRKRDAVPTYQPFSPEVPKGPYGAVYDPNTHTYKLFLIYRNTLTNKLEMPMQRGHLRQFHKLWDNVTDAVDDTGDTHALWVSNQDDAPEETNPDIINAHNLYLQLRNRLFNAILNKNIDELNAIIPKVLEDSQRERLESLSADINRGPSATQHQLLSVPNIVGLQPQAAQPTDSDSPRPIDD